jgi:uncharacterized protein YycO
MTNLAITFVRSNAQKKKPIFETFLISVTSSSTRDLINDIGTHWTGDCAYLDQKSALETIERWESQIAKGEYPAPGCIYLIEEHFSEMKDHLEVGCHAFVHYQ